MNLGFLFAGMVIIAIGLLVVRDATRAPKNKWIKRFVGYVAVIIGVLLSWRYIAAEIATTA